MAADLLVVIPADTLTEYVSLSLYRVLRVTTDDRQKYSDKTDRFK